MESAENSNSEMWERRYRREEHIVAREIAGETILVPIRGNLADMQRIFSLNPVAAYIWERLDGETHLEDISKGIVANFEVEKEEAEADIHEFITELQQADLIIGLPS
jgi:hypothetical protein